MPLIKDDFDNRQCHECGMPGCEHPMVVSGQCHPKAPVIVVYWDGVLVVKCAECGKVANEVWVSETRPAKCEDCEDKVYGCQWTAELDERWFGKT